MALKVMLNGVERTLDQLEPGADLLQVIGALELKADRVAVERNGQIARRAGWAGIRIEAGDKLEVVHFVGGG